MNKKNDELDKLINTKINYLTLLTYTRRNVKGYTRIFWNCKCDCGNTVEYQHKVLTYNSAESCGCHHPRNNKKENHPQWKGVGDLNGQYISQLKCKAVSRNLEWSVTTEFLWELFIKQDRKCKLTGLPLNIVALRAKQKGVDQSASLDRIDSLKGYTEDNVQWVHKNVNKMKMNFSQERFIEICKLVTLTQENLSPR